LIVAFVFPENKIRTAINNGTAAIGIYVETGSVAIVELAAIAGMDFIRFDLAHNAMGIDQMEKCILACERTGITPLIRIAHDHPDLERFIEMGVMGVILPDMDSAEKAQKAVNRIRFAPIGDRGLFSATRQTGYGSIPSSEYIRWSNENIIIGIQIESKEAVANLDEILQVPGIDLVHSGRGDLSNSYGVAGEKNHPIVIEAEKEIFRKARAVGLHVSPQINFDNNSLAEEIEELIQNGARAISLGIDTAIIRKAFTSIVGKAKAAIE